MTARVLAPQGHPASGALVTVSDDGGACAPRRALAVDDGRFEFRCDADASPLLRASKEGYAPSAAVRVGSGEREQDVVLQLRVGGAISGRVVDERGGPIDAGLQVTAWPVDAVGAPGSRGTRRLDVSASGRGLFRLTALAPGRWNVRAASRGRVPALVENVLVEDGVDTSLGDLRLSAGVDVVGRVVDQAGRPVSSALVRIEGLPRGTSENVLPAGGPRAETDERGRFRLRPVPSGVDGIRVQKLGWSVERRRLRSVGGGDVVGDERGSGETVDLGTIELARRPEIVASGEPGPASVGIGVRRRGGGFVVRSVVPGSSAEEAGVLSGDRLLAVAGYLVEDLRPSALMRLLRGAPGSRVAVLVGAANGGDERALELVCR